MSPSSSTESTDTFVRRGKSLSFRLALGYGGNIGALQNMGAARMGLTEAELPDIVTRWREASPKIVQLWSDLGNAMMNAMKGSEVQELQYGVRVWKTPHVLHMQIPSGRCLRYFNPKIATNKFGGESISYDAYDMGKWSRVDTWGGRAVENLIQATARDCLLVSMQRVSKRYPDIVMHVHDEMIVEVPEAEADEALAFICGEMGKPIDWAPGLLLRGDGYTTPFYCKD